MVQYQSADLCNGKFRTCHWYDQENDCSRRAQWTQRNWMQSGFPQLADRSDKKWCWCSDGFRLLWRQPDGLADEWKSAHCCDCGNSSSETPDLSESRR